jgi:general secretion pathway protein F
LNIAGAILNNKKIAAAIEPIALGVKRGEGLSAPVRRAAVFPSLAAHLLSVGEETGKLDQMFLRIADVFEEETKSAIKRFTSLFEPMIILVMGILIGALVLSMLLAITSINDVAV